MTSVFEISGDILERHPTYMVGVVYALASGPPPREKAAVIQRALREASESLPWRIGGSGLRQHPAIQAWEQAFESEGVNPSRYPPSIAALAERALRGESIPSINPAADISNLISLKHLLPVGAHDLNRLPGDIQVRLSRGGDTFTGPDGAEEAVPAGEPVYATDNNIRTRRWVWRQARNAMVGSDSRTVLFPIDGFADSTGQRVTDATEELAELVAWLFGVRTQLAYVTAAHPRLAFSSFSVDEHFDARPAVETGHIRPVNPPREAPRAVARFMPHEADSLPAPARPPADETLARWTLSDLLRRGLLDGVIVEDELKQDLASGRRLTVYEGYDPTSASLHIGHYLSLRVLRWFQLNGHRVIFLFGDFTARIGDPTGQSAERRQLSREQVAANAQTWREQISRVLDFGGDNPVEIKWNGEWLDELSLRDMIEIAARVTVQQLIERDMFQERLSQQKPLHLHETLYPLLQGFDSVAMSVDAELGGRDQMFNMMVGRDLVRNYNGKTKHVLMTPLIPGLDGRKMSKSYGNTVDLTENPIDMFFKLTQVSDDLLPLFLSALTDVPDADIEEVRRRLGSESNLQDVRERFAREVTERLHGPEAAERAHREFTLVVDRGQTRQDVEDAVLRVTGAPITTVDIAIATGLATSRGDARRLIQQGGLEINSRRETDPQRHQTPEEVSGAIIKMGKRGHVRMRVERE